MDETDHIHIRLYTYTSDNVKKVKIFMFCDETIELHDRYTWNMIKGRNGYFHLQRSILFHREIMGLEQGRDVQVDHKNVNCCDNRMCNLRPCNQSQNMQNRNLQVNNSSGYKNVTFMEDRQKWRARVTVNGKREFIGDFDNREDAYNAFCERAKETHGDFVIS